MSSKILQEIRKQISAREKELTALVQAANLLSATAAGRGRKVLIKSNLASILADANTEDDAEPGKRKRGRPAGTGKKKAASKGTGKRGRPAKNDKAPVAKKGTGKRGRPPGTKNKPGAKKTGPKSSNATSTPVKSKPVKKNSKRNRVPNLSGKIVELIKDSKKFVSNSHITDQLLALYPGKDRGYMGKYISVILSNMRVKKVLGNVTADAKGTRLPSALWGLSEWFDGKAPRAEYMK